MTKKTTMTFDTAGGIKVDAEGFTGKACQDTTDKLLATLSGGSRDESTKPEFSQPEKATGGNVQQRSW